tara:strand:- start:1603 stop:2877 length:1275 start_codon:yes stop_codon:yes gene_type:complete
MQESFNFKKKSFAVYGLGLTGKSVVNFLKKNKANKIFTWDDNSIKANLKLKTKFKFCLNLVDYIIISPGINILKSKFKKILIKNKKKIITDLDLFFLKNNVKKSVVVTGTNGKSTTCSLIHHILTKNKIKNELAGNIGRPILDLKFIKNQVYIIEASSFQLEYSKFIKPYCAAILNISQDHLEWHGSKKKYVMSKMKIFKNQTRDDIAFLNDLNLKKIYRSNKFFGKLISIKKNPIKLKDIHNRYLQLETNTNNILFAYFITKLFKINKNNFLTSLKSFKGLSHRHEIFFKFGSNTFINDSKATSFESTKCALKSNNNIIWITGGQPKKNDKINIDQFRKKIVKAYIIGNHTNFFIKKIRKKIKFEVTKNLKVTVNKIFKFLNKKQKLIILFSPASASYDQFKNFVERGEKFKNLVKYNAKKFY